MFELTPEIEQQLADMNDGEWRALTARVRPPQPGAAGKDEAQRRITNQGVNR